MIDSQLRTNTAKIEKYNERLIINAIRAVAVFLMMWGHMIQRLCIGFVGFGTPVHKFIYSFHMPLFILISGYLFYYSVQKYTLKQIVIRKAKSLLYPLVTCRICYFFLVTCAMDLLFQHDYHSLFSGEWAKFNDSIWFFWTAFAVVPPVALAEKVTNKKVIKALVILLGFVFVAFFPYRDRNILLYPYFVLGYLYSKYKGIIPKQVKLVSGLLSTIFFWIMLIYFDPNRTIYAGLYFSNCSVAENIAISAYRFFIGLFGCIMIVSFVTVIYRYVTTKAMTWINRCLTRFSQLGKYSLQFYYVITITDSWLIVLFSSIIPENNVFVDHIWLFSLVFTLIIAIMYTIGVYWLSKGLAKTKIEKLLFAR